MHLLIYAIYKGNCHANEREANLTVIQGEIAISGLTIRKIDTKCHSPSLICHFLQRNINKISLLSQLLNATHLPQLCGCFKGSRLPCFLPIFIACYKPYTALWTVRTAVTACLDMPNAVYLLT